MKKNQMKKSIRVGISIFVISFCTIAFLFAQNDPNKVDLSIRLLSPNSSYPFGTDTMGRCVLSRVLYGGYSTVGIVLLSSLIIIGTGTPMGLFMGYYKGRHNFIGDGLLNALTALPPIAYLIVFIGAWGSGITTTLAALTFAVFFRIIKLVKAKTEVEKEKAYVLCAIASGASHSRIVFRHILPNLIKEVIVFLSLSCGDMILMITSFSFLGLGLGDEVIDWGGMILEGRAVSGIRPDIMIYPIIFVFFCTFSFNKLGEALE